MSRRRGPAVLKPPTLDELYNDNPPPSVSTPAAVPRESGSVRFSHNRPQTLGIQAVAAMVPPPSPPQGRVYTADEVNNLPQKLEKEISELHSSIAKTLITKSDILNDSAQNLKIIETTVQRFIETSKGKDEVNADCYKKLSAIGSDHKVSATTISNKRKVIDQFVLILEEMQIPDKWKQTLNQTEFSLDSVPDVQNVLIEATNALDEKNTPKLLVGLLAARERQHDIDVLLSLFADRFVVFFKNFLSNQAMLEDALRRSKPVTNIPREDLTQAPKPFSEDVSNHKILRAIYSYSNILLWIKRKFPNSYDSLINYFHIASNKYTMETLTEIIQEAIKSIQAIKIPAMAKDVLFTAGSNMKHSDAKRIWSILESSSNQIFCVLTREKVILQQFWDSSNQEMFSDILHKDILKLIETMWDSAQKYDMFFLLRGVSLNYSIHKEKKIALDILISSMNEKWDKYIQSLVDIVQGVKFNPKKTHILDPFKHFPTFISKISEHKLPYDQDIIDIAFDRLVIALQNWIANVVGPKADPKKRERLIVVNIFYMMSKLISSNKESLSEGMISTLQTTREFLETHINLLLKDLVRKAWKKPTKFFHQITTWMTHCNLTPEVVTFQPSHTDEKFQELVLDMEKSFVISYNSCIQTLTSKIKYPSLREQIVQSLSPFIENLWKRWDELAISCYSKSISPNIETVQHTIYPNGKPES